MAIIAKAEGKHRARKAAETAQSRRERHDSRLRVHLTCVTIGLIMTVVASYAPVALVHLAPALPVLPSAVQEVLDRLFHLS